MANIVLDVNNHKHFKKDDMLIHNGKNFESISKEFLLKDITELKNRIMCLEHEVVLLQAQLDYDHGIINESEFNELCNGNK